MKDPLKEILETNFHGMDKRKEIGLLLDRIDSQDVLKLLTIVPHQDLYNGIQEEAIQRITDEDFLDKLGDRFKLKMNTYSSGTWDYCQKRLIYLKFLKDHKILGLKANSKYGSNFQNSFTHLLSRIEGTTLDFYTNDLGGYWVLKLQSPHHRGKSEYIYYLENQGNFVLQNKYDNPNLKNKVLGTSLGADPMEALQSLLDHYNKKIGLRWIQEQEITKITSLS